MRAEHPEYLEAITFLKSITAGTELYAQVKYMWDEYIQCLCRNGCGRILGSC